MKFALIVNGVVAKSGMTYHKARRMADQFLDGNVQIRPELN